jgi:iron(III) transport system permease protein
MAIVTSATSARSRGGSLGSQVRSSVVRQAPWVALFVVIALLILWPLARLEVNAFTDGMAGLREAASLRNIGSTIANTLLLGFGSVIIAVPLGTLLAWTSSRMTPRQAKWFGMVPLLPLVFPAVAGVTGWAFLLSPRVGYINSFLRRTPFFDHLNTGPLDAFSIPMIIAITGILLTSFVYLFVRTGLSEMGQGYEAAAAASGASTFRTLFTVTLPLLRPSIVYATGIVVLLGLGQFTVPLLLGRQRGINVLTTEMYLLVQDAPIDFGLGAALGLPLLFAGILVVLAQKRAIGDARRFVTADRSGTFGALRQRRRWPVVVMLLYTSMAVALPVLAIIHVAVSPFWTGSLTFDNLTLRHVASTLESSRLRDAITTSVLASFSAVIIVLPIGFAAAVAMLKRSRIAGPLRSTIDVTASLPLGVPAALFGFGLLFAYTRPPLLIYGQVISIVIAYATIMVPHAMRFQLTSLISLGDEAWDASRACGAGPVRSLFRVVIPMARSGIAAAAAIIVIMLFHEFAASLMVRGAGTQVMGTILYDLWVGGLYPQVAVVALVMVVVTTLGVVLAFRLGGSKALGSGAGGAG